MTNEFVSIERPGYPKVTITLEDWSKIMGYAHHYMDSPANRGAIQSKEDVEFRNRLDWIDQVLGA